MSTAPSVTRGASRSASCKKLATSTRTCSGVSVRSPLRPSRLPGRTRLHRLTSMALSSRPRLSRSCAAELANKKAAAEAEAAAAAAAFEQKPAVADSEVCVPTSDTPPHPADRRFPSTGGGATPSNSPGAGRRGGPLPDRLAPLYRGQRVWDGSVCSQARASSAHGGSGRHTIKIDHDPPSPVGVRFESEK